MVRRIRIPLLIDIVRVSAPETIRAINDHRSLDRGFDAAGPLFNRFVTRRLRKVLHTGARPLPTILKRGDADRAAAQTALAERLGRAPAEDLLDAPTLAALAAFVRGEGGDVGPLTQQLIGRLFVEGYEATGKTWAAAVTLQKAVESNNPLRHMLWRLTGRIADAQRKLAKAAGEDPAAFHATSIAVHNLVTAMDTLAALYRSKRNAGADEAVARALVGPETIVRQANAHADSLVGSLRPGTLVASSIREAGQRSLDPRVTFMSGSWSACPARDLVPAIIALVWSRAKAS